MLAQEVIDQIGAENLGSTTFSFQLDQSSAGPQGKMMRADAADNEGPFVPNSYDATFMMALAIEKAGSADRSAIAGAHDDNY